MVADMKDRREEFENEQGYVLLAVIFLMVILLISLAIAAPKMARSIQRDKELETVHRGQQYKRAIKMYYQKFGSYPTSIDQLVQTNQIRFLRKKYTDPLTGKNDWKPVYYGQAHVRPLGFFGQPLMTAGVGVGGSMYAVAATTTTDANGVPIASGDQSGTGAAGNSAGSGFGSSGSSFGSSGSSFGSSGSSFGSSGSSFGSSGSSFGSSGSSFGSSGSSFGSSGSSFGQQGGNSSMFGQSTPTSGTGSSTGSPFGSSGTGTSATTFGGGGPIVGFTLPVDKPSLIDYKLQTRYNKWEFNYDPTEEQAQALAGLSGGAPTGTNPTGMNPTGTTPGTTMPGTLPTNPNPTTPPGPTDPTSPQQ
jgi:type II secretory pathway pseudopilin PulG